MVTDGTTAIEILQNNCERKLKSLLEYEKVFMHDINNSYQRTLSLLKEAYTALKNEVQEKF